MSAIAGRVLLIPKGAYNALTLYAMLDVVSYNGNSYVAKKSTQGNTPSADTEYWMILASGTAVASINDIGDVLITSATNGQVLKYDATLQRWVNGEDTGGLLPHLVITSETGATVTVVKGGDTITATETSTGVYECDVPEFGTYTCHSLLNGDDATVTVNVDTVKVYNISNAHFSATITVTFPENSTCSCGKAGETPQTASVSPHTFTVHSTGTYTVSSTDGTSTASTTVSIVTDGQTESVTLSYVPDGSTVTPTDDIQIWLNCGNIWDKAYTTLGEVLDDSTTLSALMASNNAVDYMVRSTVFATSVSLVPVMTSNTTPSGECFASTHLSGVEPYIAFNGVTTGSWISGENQITNQYVGYSFDSPTKVGKAKIYPTWTSSNHLAVKNWKIEATNDKSGTWTTLASGTFPDSNVGWQEVNFSNNSNYLHYRLFVTDIYTPNNYVMVSEVQFCTEDGLCDSSTAMSYIGLNNYCANTLLADSTWCNAICNSEYFESVLNVKVPAMTSNTTPEGICSATLETGGLAYKAFDEDLGTYWATSSTTSGTVYYEFTKNVTILLMTYAGYGSSYGANSVSFVDGNNTVIKTQSMQNITGAQKVYIGPNNYSTRKYGCRVNGTFNNQQASAVEVQFYGREDI